MKFNRPFTLLTLLLSAALVVSVALNYLLFRWWRQFYYLFNATRLYPLGLDEYPVGPGKRDPASADLPMVVFFGDSRAASWPPPDLNQFEFINRGIDGQTSKQVIQRFDDHVRPLGPEVIVVQVCINDLTNIPLFPEKKATIIADCKENIEAILARSVELGATVILTTVFPVGNAPIEYRLFWSGEVALAVSDVNAFIHSLEGENVIVFDTFSLLADAKGFLRSEYSQDFLHLNLAGYQALNNELISLLTGLE